MEENEGLIGSALIALFIVILVWFINKDSKQKTDKHQS